MKKYLCFYPFLFAVLMSRFACAEVGEEVNHSTQSSPSLEKYRMRLATTKQVGEGRYLMLDNRLLFRINIDPTKDLDYSPEGRFPSTTEVYLKHQKDFRCRLFPMDIDVSMSRTKMKKIVEDLPKILNIQELEDIKIEKGLIWLLNKEIKTYDAEVQLDDGSVWQRKGAQSSLLKDFDKGSSILVSLDPTGAELIHVDHREEKLASAKGFVFCRVMEGFGEESVENSDSSNFSKELVFAEGEYLDFSLEDLQGYQLHLIDITQSVEENSEHWAYGRLSIELQLDRGLELFLSLDNTNVGQNQFAQWQQNPLPLEVRLVQKEDPTHLFSLEPFSDCVTFLPKETGAQLLTIDQLVLNEEGDLQLKLSDGSLWSKVGELEEKLKQWKLNDSVLVYLNPDQSATLVNFSSNPGFAYATDLVSGFNFLGKIQVIDMLNPALPPLGESDAVDERERLSKAEEAEEAEEALAFESAEEEEEAAEEADVTHTGIEA